MLGPDIAVSKAAASASERVCVMPLIVDQIREFRGVGPRLIRGKKPWMRVGLLS